MSLLDLWNNDPNQIEEKHVQQLITFSGEGKLLDGNTTSKELRELLSIIPSELLSKFVKECLETKEIKFKDSGFALQDIVNEIGRRLGFKVIPGRYRGSSKQVGFDGLWTSSLGEAIVVEVKTTSAYNIDLNIVANYRKELIKNGEIPSEKTSILIVVGRFDTGGWEAQIRGSKHAWDTRLISVEGLIRLLGIKENLDDPSILTKIRDILIPHEYTKVDGIIDIVFSAAEDIKAELPSIPDDIEGDEPEISGKGKKDKSPRFTPVSFHQECLKRVEKKLGTLLVKESRSIFATPDNSIAIACLVSKTHKKSLSPRFWFSFHPHQKDRLLKSKKGFVVLGCGSPNLALLVPISVLVPWLDKVNTTESENRLYWHLHLEKVSKTITLKTKAGFDRISLNEYILS